MTKDNVAEILVFGEPPPRLGFSEVHHLDITGLWGEIGHIGGIVPSLPQPLDQREVDALIEPPPRRR